MQAAEDKRQRLTSNRLADILQSSTSKQRDYAADAGKSANRVPSKLIWWAAVFLTPFVSRLFRRKTLINKVRRRYLTASRPENLLQLWSQSCVLLIHWRIQRRNYDVAKQAAEANAPFIWSVCGARHFILDDFSSLKSAERFYLDGFLLMMFLTNTVITFTSTNSSHKTWPRVRAELVRI